MSSTESQLSYPTPIREASAEVDVNFPPPPQNKETAPFSVLSSLFDKLQGERKPEKRQRLLNSWFNVHSLSRVLPRAEIDRSCSTGEEKKDTIYTLS